MTSNDPSAEILSVIRRIDSAWQEGPRGEIVSRIVPCLDPNVVFCAGNFQVVGRGADVCAKSYEQFVQMAAVHDFKAPDPQIHIAGDAATAVCPWTMTYTLDKETYTESGHDLLVFTRNAGQWQVMWRAMVPAATS